MVNHFIFCAVFAWLTAQLFKLILTLIITKKLDFTRLTGSGGMPSAHTAFFTSLSVLILLIEGFNSAAFAISACTTAMVMYDANGVRRAAGEQAKILNKMANAWMENDNSLDFGKNLKELIGHSKTEVFVGFIYGIIVGVMYYLLIIY